MIQGGDDLTDDFIPDELVALSEEEEGDNEDDVGESLSGEGDEGVAEGSRIDKTAEEKKRKRKVKERERKAKKRKLVETIPFIEPASLAVQPPLQLVEYLSSMQSKTFSKLSGIELGDLLLPASCIADTTIWTGPRTLDQLVDFLVKICPELRVSLSQNPRRNGAPCLIFVAGAALRVADVTRVLKTKKLRGEIGGDVAKLFARHIKLEEHVKYLKRTKIGAAVGTPGRLGKLLSETDALSTSNLTHIMLDVSYRDAKKRSLLDIPETRDEVFRLFLGAPKVLNVIRRGNVKLVLF